jgi:hypothetical protein
MLQFGYLKLQEPGIIVDIGTLASPSSCVAVFLLPAVSVNRCMQCLTSHTLYVLAAYFLSHMNISCYSVLGSILCLSEAHGLLLLDLPLQGYSELSCTPAALALLIYMLICSLLKRLL